MATTPTPSPEDQKALLVLTEIERVRQEGGDVEQVMREKVRYMTTGELAALRLQLTQPPTNPSPQLPETFRQQTAERLRLLELTQRQLEALDLARRQGSVIAPNDGSLLPDIDTKRNPLFWSGRRWKDEAKWGVERTVDVATENPAMTVTAVVGGAGVLYALNRLRKWAFGPRAPRAAAPGAAPGAAPAAPGAAPAAPANESRTKRFFMAPFRFAGRVLERALSNILSVAIVGGVVGGAVWYFFGDRIKKVWKTIESLDMDKFRDEMKKMSDEIVKKIAEGNIEEAKKAAASALNSTADTLAKFDAPSGKRAALLPLEIGLNATVAKLDATGDKTHLDGVLAANGFGGTPPVREVTGTDGTKFRMEFDPVARRFSVPEPAPVVLPPSPDRARTISVLGLFSRSDDDRKSPITMPVFTMHRERLDALLKNRPALLSTSIKFYTDVAAAAETKMDDAVALVKATFSISDADSIDAVIKLSRFIREYLRDGFLKGRNVTNGAMLNLTLQQVLDLGGQHMRLHERLQENRTLLGTLDKQLDGVFSPDTLAVESVDPTVRASLVAGIPVLAGHETAFLEYCKRNVGMPIGDMSAAVPEQGTAPAPVTQGAKELIVWATDESSFSALLTDPTLLSVMGAKDAVVTALKKMSLVDAVQLRLFMQECNVDGAPPGTFMTANRMGRGLLLNKIAHLLCKTGNKPIAEEVLTKLKTAF